MGSYKIKNKIYSNFNTKTNPLIRTPLKNYCYSNNNFTNEEGLTYHNFVKGVKSHKATLSPRGNGVECIRTYEVLYLNSIPIVYGDSKEYKAINNKIYKNLPIVFTDNLNDLGNYKFIENQIKKIQNNSLETLDYYYWVDKIKQTINKI